MLFGVQTILEPENVEHLPLFEVRLRKCFSLGFRIALAVFAVSHLFDFLFSSVWMHGYIWSLNLPIDMDMTDKPAGAIVRHQLDEMNHLERIIQSILGVIGVLMLIIASGFTLHPGQSVWRLFRISSIVGMVCGLIRPCQMRQRFFSSLHEAFYAYFMFFIVAFILTVRFDEKFEKSKPKIE